MAVSALRKHATLLKESAKRQARCCRQSSTYGCRRGAGKAPALTRRRHSDRGCVTVRGWLCICVWGNLAGLRGRCLAERALNCRCRHKQGTSKYEPGYARDTCRSLLVYKTIHSDTVYELRYVQIRTGIRADTNWDTCRYELYLSRYGKNTYRSTYISTYKYVRKNAYINMSGTYSYVFNTHRIRTYKTADEVCSVSHYVYHNIDISMLVLWSQGKGRRGPICQHSNGSR